MINCIVINIKVIYIILKKGSVKESIYEALNTYCLHNRKGELSKILPVCFPPPLS